MGPAHAQYLLDDGSEIQTLGIFQECANCPEMIALPLGEFVMGGPPGESRDNVHWERGNIRYVTPDDPYIAKHEGPLHSVTIDLPIAMGRNVVTYGEWMACVSGGGCGGYEPKTSMKAARPGSAPLHVDLMARHPVLYVSYQDMQLYIDWLNGKVGADVYRIPTEAEWEYAARAGTQTPFAQGEEINTDQANFLGRATEKMLGEKRPDLVSRGFPVSVDDLDAANQWGLRHMSGNVLERTMSCMQKRHANWPTSSRYLEMARDTPCDRVSKGGVYTSAMNRSRPGARGGTDEEYRSKSIGFRIVRSLTPMKETE